MTNHPIFGFINLTKRLMSDNNFPCVMSMCLMLEKNSAQKYKACFYDVKYWHQKQTRQLVYPWTRSKISLPRFLSMLWPTVFTIHDFTKHINNIFLHSSVQMLQNIDANMQILIASNKRKLSTTTKNGSSLIVFSVYQNIKCTCK